MSKPVFQDRPPPSACVTDYDGRHLVNYLRLLEAAKQGADWREVALVVFGIDAAAEPERARSVYHEHLVRAQWMCQCGYIQLKDRR